MPRRRPLRAFARNDTGGPAVETALVLGLVAVMVVGLKTAVVDSLVRPTKQAFVVLLRALS
jgi:Flp pilus assembly pilin Flp